MLLAATQLAARSVYVGGNTSSTTGLTVTMTKEQNGEPGIEAGALVLADQGVCAIDEFDKMAKAHQDGESRLDCIGTVADLHSEKVYWKLWNSNKLASQRQALSRHLLHAVAYWLLPIRSMEATI